MKTISNILLMVLLNHLVLFNGKLFAQEIIPCPEGSAIRYYGVEINGTLCGYAFDNECTGVYEGRPVHYEKSEVILKMSLLGAELDASILSLYGIDPQTGKTLVIKYAIKNGQSVVNTETILRNDSAFFSSSSSGLSRSFSLKKDVITTSPSWYPHLLSDFVKNKLTEKKYTVYDPIRGEPAEKEYIRKGEEVLKLADSTFQALILEETDLSNGIKSILWLNKADGFNLKVNVANRNIYLAGKSVVGKISMVDMNNLIFAKVNRVIPDIMNVTSMKVRAKIDSYGEVLTSESLNTPGQKFTGTVTGSLVDGIFEMKPEKYDGSGAPPFPPDFGKSKELKKYLAPELVIESDDPMIIAEAKKIAEGSSDSWIAATRLSKWVAEKIAGAIPGGISAINTLKTREAECGGHSRLLAAFCRALGIPARVVVGCMYTTYYGGSFGQHAWTEVYMGNAGWKTLDATIGENNVVDAGHIRLGEKATFQPESMEIMDNQTGSTQPTDGITPVPDKYKTLTGKYTDMNNFRVFKVIYKDGSLSVDIPGQMVLALNEPDSQGEWYPKMSRQLSFSFLPGRTDRIEKMLIRQIAPMKKSSNPDVIDMQIPEKFRRYPGNYSFGPAKLSVDVSYSQNGLMMQDPLRKSKEPLKLSDQGGYWTDAKGFYEVRFNEGSDNQITGMNLTLITKLLRGEPVSNLLETVIKESGIEAAIKKYQELRNAGSGEYLTNEYILNRLGHKLLEEGKTGDALEIFILNEKENPDSFLAHDSLAETYLKNGENKLAMKYFKESVKLNPDYEYGKKMIEELKLKK